MSPPFDYLLFLKRLLPETFVVLGGLVLLFSEQSMAARSRTESRTSFCIALALLTCAVAGLALFAQGSFGSFYNGMLVITPFTKIVKGCLLILLAGTIMIGVPARFTNHIGEYFSLLLFGGVGLLFLASAEELLSAFIALELTSLSLYLLTGFNKESPASAEAAMKYFLFGSVAAAFTLFGISLIFGLAGATSFSQINIALQPLPLSPLLIAGIVLTAIGFGFKIAAAPLHLWAPDAYQGAPAPSAAFIASGSKLASLVVFGKLFILAFHSHAGNAAFGSAASGWKLVIALLATISMLLGNLLAIAQSNFRRLIAYSAIAHGGYALIAILAATDRGLSSAVFYMFTYGLAVVGIFAIVSQIEQKHGDLSIRDFAGLSRRSPILAISLAVFILSLAGIPPLAGFFGKFYVFLAALDSGPKGGTPGLLWIVATAIATSAVSLYYYLQVLKQAFVIESDATPTRLGSLPCTAVIVILAASVVFLGCFPQVLLEPLEAAFNRPPTTSRDLTSISPDVSSHLE